MQKCANLVELEKCCQTHIIFLKIFVLIQPRTSPPKFCKFFKKKRCSRPAGTVRSPPSLRRIPSWPWSCACWPRPPSTRSQPRPLVRPSVPSKIWHPALSEVSRTSLLRASLEGHFFSISDTSNMETLNYLLFALVKNLWMHFALVVSIVNMYFSMISPTITNR